MVFEPFSQTGKLFIRADVSDRTMASTFSPGDKHGRVNFKESVNSPLLTFDIWNSFNIPNAAIY
jgi:hypothetical protein